VAKKPTPPPEVPDPEDFPQTTPRDLYATSDIRFVMLEIGKLMTKVEGLSSSVDKQGDKLDDIAHKVTFVKGALWVIGGLITVGLLILGWYLSGKLSVTYTPTPPAA
jgi:hypothetical protein